MLNMLSAFVPLIPELIKTGLATYETYAKVETIIRENRKPSEPEWDALEAQIAADKATLHDTSRDA